MAVSACISPSTSRSGRLARRISTARRTFSLSGVRALPKFENESIAIRGVTLNVWATAAALAAISASCSAVGFTLTVASLKKYGTLRTIMR